MSEMKDKGWDEMAAIWQAQPVPDVRKIAAQVQNQHRRLMRRQTKGIAKTILMVAMAGGVFFLEPDAWFRAWWLVLAGYVVLQQYVILRSARGLFRKHDKDSVKAMLEHLARHYRQRIYRSYLRMLDTAVLGIVSIPLIWHLSGGRWDGLFSHSDAGFLAIGIPAAMVLGLWLSFRGMPRFRRKLHEAESLRRTLGSDEEDEQTDENRL
jgi:hypothetical protein